MTLAGFVGLRELLEEIQNLETGNRHLEAHRPQVCIQIRVEIGGLLLIQSFLHGRAPCLSSLSRYHTGESGDAARGPDPRPSFSIL